MDKGIFYLVCTVVILIAFAAGFYTLNQAVARSCNGKATVVTRTIEVTPTLAPTATPSAMFKRVVAPTRSVK